MFVLTAYLFTKVYLNKVKITELLQKKLVNFISFKIKLQIYHEL